MAVGPDGGVAGATPGPVQDRARHHCPRRPHLRGQPRGARRQRVHARRGARPCAAGHPAGSRIATWRTNTRTTSSYCWSPSPPSSRRRRLRVRRGPDHLDHCARRSQSRCSSTCTRCGRLGRPLYYPTAGTTANSPCSSTSRPRHLEGIEQLLEQNRAAARTGTSCRRQPEAGREHEADRGGVRADREAARALAAPPTPSHADPAGRNARAARGAR